MLQALIELYPWDLCDEGVDVVLDHLQGEVGLTGIALWAATGPVLQMRRRPVDPRVFRTRGGVGYHADESRYTATRIAPPTADWVGGENMLSQACEACAQRGLDIRAVVSSGMVEGDRCIQPGLATRNAFGAESQSHLCLLNPEVQGYVQALLEEMRDRFGFSCFELADFGATWGEAGALQISGGARYSPMVRFLLDSCWCDSCVAQAGGNGVDAESARGAMVHGLDRYFGRLSSDDAALRPLLSDDGPVGKYLKWQSCRFQAWFERLKSDVSRRILVRQAASEGVGDEFAASSRIADSDKVEVLSSISGADASNDVIGGASEVHILASVMERWDAHEVVSRFSGLAQAGATCITAGNYGLMAPETLVGVRQAVRFARRLAS